MLITACKWLHPAQEQDSRNAPRSSTKIVDLPTADGADQGPIPAGSLPSSFDGFLPEEPKQNEDPDRGQEPFVPTNEQECAAHSGWKWREGRCQRKAMADYCLLVDGVDPDIQKTVSTLASMFGSCEEAARYLDAARSLDLSGKDLTSIAPLHGLPLLAHLDLSNNRIRDISPLANAKGLNVLNVSHNQITNIETVGLLRGLVELNMSYNPVASIFSLRGLTNLRNLAAIQIAAQDLAFVGDLKQLTFLSISGNRLDDLSFLRSLSELRFLDAADNAIEELEALKSLPKLEYLSLANNQVRDLRALAGLARLKTANLKHNRIQSLRTLSYMPSLEQLDLTANEIAEIDIATVLVTLFHLNLSDNPLKDLGSLVKALPQLRTLVLDRCRVEDYSPLNLLPYLEEVSARECHLVDGQRGLIKESIRFIH